MNQLVDSLEDELVIVAVAFTAFQITIKYKKQHEHVVHNFALKPSLYYKTDKVNASAIGSQCLSAHAKDTLLHRPNGELIHNIIQYVGMHEEADSNTIQDTKKKVNTFVRKLASTLLLEINNVYKGTKKVALSVLAFFVSVENMLLPQWQMIMRSFGNLERSEKQPEGSAMLYFYDEAHLRAASAAHSGLRSGIHTYDSGGQRQGTQTMPEVYIITQFFSTRLIQYATDKTECEEMCLSGVDVSLLVIIKEHIDHMLQLLLNQPAQSQLLEIVFVTNVYYNFLNAVFNGAFVNKESESGPILGLDLPLRDFYHSIPRFELTNERLIDSVEQYNSQQEVDKRILLEDTESNVSSTFLPLSILESWFDDGRKKLMKIATLHPTVAYIGPFSAMFEPNPNHACFLSQGEHNVNIADLLLYKGTTMVGELPYNFSLKTLFRITNTTHATTTTQHAAISNPCANCCINAPVQLLCRILPFAQYFYDSGATSKINLTNNFAEVGSYNAIVTRQFINLLQNMNSNPVASSTHLKEALNENQVQLKVVKRLSSHAPINFAYEQQEDSHECLTELFAHMGSDLNRVILPPAYSAATVGTNSEENSEYQNIRSWFNLNRLHENSIVHDIFAFPTCTTSHCTQCNFHTSTIHENMLLLEVCIPEHAVTITVAFVPQIPSLGFLKEACSRGDSDEPSVHVLREYLAVKVFDVSFLPTQSLTELHSKIWRQIPGEYIQYESNGLTLYSCSSDGTMVETKSVQSIHSGMVVTACVHSPFLRTIAMTVRQPVATTSDELLQHRVVGQPIRICSNANMSCLELHCLVLVNLLHFLGEDSDYASEVHSAIVDFCNGKESTLKECSKKLIVLVSNNSSVYNPEITVPTVDLQNIWNDSQKTNKKARQTKAQIAALHKKMASWMEKAQEKGLEELFNGSILPNEDTTSIDELYDHSRDLNLTVNLTGFNATVLDGENIDQRDIHQTKKGVTLELCVEEYLSSEQLECDCPLDPAHKERIKSVTLSSFIPPRVLLINLKRYRNDQSKISTSIFTKMNTWNLSDFFHPKQEDVSFVYNLIGTVHHRGTQKSGHFWTVAREWAGVADPIWERPFWLYNDTIVKPLTNEEAKQYICDAADIVTVAYGLYLPNDYPTEAVVSASTTNTIHSVQCDPAVGGFHLDPDSDTDVMLWPYGDEDNESDSDSYAATEIVRNPMSNDAPLTTCIALTAPDPNQNQVHSTDEAIALEYFERQRKDCADSINMSHQWYQNAVNSFIDVVICTYITQWNKLRNYLPLAQYINRASMEVLACAVALEENRTVYLASEEAYLMRQYKARGASCLRMIYHWRKVLLAFALEWLRMKQTDNSEAIALSACHALISHTAVCQEQESVFVRLMVHVMRQSNPDAVRNLVMSMDMYCQSKAKSAGCKLNTTCRWNNPPTEYQPSIEVNEVYAPQEKIMQIAAEEENTQHDEGSNQIAVDKGSVFGDNEASDDAASDDTAGDNEASDDAASDDSAGDNEASDDAASDDSAGDNEASDDAPSDDAPSDDAAGDDAAGDDAAGDDAAGDDAAVWDTHFYDSLSDPLVWEDLGNNDSRKAHLMTQEKTIDEILDESTDEEDRNNFKQMIADLPELTLHTKRSRSGSDQSSNSSSKQAQ